MTRSLDQLRIIAGQSHRRAMHCPICSYPRFDAPELAIGKGRIRQLCAGHTRDRYTIAHQTSLRLLAEVATQLVEILEATP